MNINKYSYYAGSVMRLLGGVEPWWRVVPIFLGTGGKEIKEIRLRPTGTRFRVRGAMDVWIVKETFLDRFYERYGTPVRAGWTVVDIGAGIGDFSIYAAQQGAGSRIYAFEPFPDSFNLLQENLRLNGIENVEAFAEAVGGQEGTLTLDLSSGEPLQFRSGVEGEEVLQVPAISLQGVLDRLGIERCDLLKMDCEGAEYPILLHAPDPTLKRVERIVMEYHDLPEHEHGELVDFLRRRGFAVRTVPNPVHGDIGFLYASR